MIDPNAIHDYNDENILGENFATSCKSGFTMITSVTEEKKLYWNTGKKQWEESVSYTIERSANNSAECKYIDGKYTWVYKTQPYQQCTGNLFIGYNNEEIARCTLQNYVVIFSILHRDLLFFSDKWI